MLAATDLPWILRRLAGVEFDEATRRGTARCPSCMGVDPSLSIEVLPTRSLSLRCPNCSFEQIEAALRSTRRAPAPALLVPPAKFEERMTALPPDRREAVAQFAARSIRDVPFLNTPAGHLRAWELAFQQDEEHHRTKPKAALPPEKHTGPILIMTPLSEIKPRKVEWVWPGRIPLAKLTLLDGDPKTGKSTALLDLAARVTTGRAMPDGTGGGEPRGVVILSAEDDLEEGIRPRLDEAHGDASRVFIPKLATPEGERDPVITDTDIAAMEQWIGENRAALIVVDPLVSYMPDVTDTNSDHSVRRTLNRLKGLAERTRCAIVMVRHFKKAATENALHRGGGSIAFAAAARSVLVVAHDPDDPPWRVLAVAGTNLAPIAPSLKFRLVPSGDVTRVEWSGVSSHSADHLAAASPRDAVALKEAKTFLLAELPGPAGEVDAAAKAAGIAQITLRRAMTALGVKSRKIGGRGGRSYWERYVPEGAQADGD